MELLYGHGLASLRARGAEPLDRDGEVLRVQLGWGCVHARHHPGPHWVPGKEDRNNFCNCDKTQTEAGVDHNLLTRATLHKNSTADHTGHAVPGTPVGLSTGLQLKAACSQTRLHTQPELERGPGLDAGKPPRCQPGAAAGTQKPFPDPPDAASL